MILRIWQWFLARSARRQSMGWLLSRQDERLLQDIGLTKEDLKNLLGWKHK
ncbi:MAG: hypothetical protein ACJASV_000633 [Pseudorhodobacter sp.]|jgi:uncharacterized protein YjiS (DUF1127 family)